MTEYPIPGFPDYTIDDELTVRSYRYRKVRIVRAHRVAGSKFLRVNLNKRSMGESHHYSRSLNSLYQEAQERYRKKTRTA